MYAHIDIEILKKGKKMAETNRKKEEKISQNMDIPLTNEVNYIKDVSFENPGVLNFLTHPGKQPEIQINLNVQVNALKEKVFEVSLLIEAKAKTEDKSAFLVDLTYAGIFGVTQDVSEEVLKPLLLIEAPKMLFPFARNIVAELTRNGGMPPLLLNPVNFAALYQQQHTQAPQEASKH